MRSRALILVLMTFLVAGCLTTRPLQEYALSDVVEGSTELTAMSPGAPLQLRRVLVPDYLDTTDIIMRVGAHELRESSSGHWSERLSQGITRAIWADLAARLPFGTLTLAQRPTIPMREILVSIDAFDVWPDGRCQLVANWSILDTDHKRVLAADHGIFSVTGVRDRAEDRAVVAGMARALEKLADAISAETPGAVSPSLVADPKGTP